MANKQITVWDFRSNIEYYTKDELTNFLNKLGKKWVFQGEEGETTQYKHWQGRISLFKIARKSELMKLIKGMDMKVPNYLEPTTTTEHKKEAFYVMKEATRTEGPYLNTDKASYIPIQYRDIVLYPYQQQIIDSRNIVDFRCVNLIIDKTGNTGKSTVASIADLCYGGIDLPPMNDGEKVIQSCCNILMSKMSRKPGLMFFDMPRSIDKNKLGGMFAAIEQIKKGKVYDVRNSYTEWWFDSPQIWVFTNEAPNLQYLSSDRWKFWGIDSEKNLVTVHKCSLS